MGLDVSENGFQLLILSADFYYFFGPKYIMMLFDKFVFETL